MNYEGIKYKQNKIIELQFYFIWFNELKHSYLHQYSNFKSKYHERKLEKATQPNQTIYIYIWKIYNQYILKYDFAHDTKTKR